MTHRRNARGAVLALALLGLAGGSLAAQAPTPAKTVKNPRQEGLPLEPARKLAYTAREGSWLSLDVSPDGQTLVFDLLGDLYTLPVTGGKATRITQGMGFDSQPRFSPDGKRVVFVSDRDGGENLWILSLDRGDTVQVTKGKTALYQSPEWSPDGRYLVATKAAGGPGKLWMYHVEGGSGLQLIKEPEPLRTTGAAFGKDGRYVWFAQRTGNWQYNSGLSDYQLAVYDRETGERSTKSFRYGGAFRPTLSPDGRWLVYGTRQVAETGLRLRDLTTGEEKWLAYPVQRDEMESMATRDVYPGMSFTPDSKALVVSYGGKIWRVPVDGTAPTQIPFEADVDVDIGPALDFDYRVSDDAAFTVRQIRNPVPSPDGRRVAFTAMDRLYVMDFPQGTPRQIGQATANEHQPAWSPDGRWIAYSTWSNREGGHLYKVRADGGRPQRLTTASALYQQPVWSLDGRRVVAIRGPAQAFQEAFEAFAPGSATDLVWIPAEGGAAQVITPVNFTAPHFTRRDPERIYAYSGSAGLISFRWDGTDRREHLKVTGSTLPGAKQPISASLVMMAPDGDQALAQILNDLYVVTVPVTGGAVPTVSLADPANAAVPARKLTEIGGQFPTWGADGNRVHWSIGNAHVVYDLRAAQAFDDSVKAAKRAEKMNPATPDSAKADTAKADSAKAGAKKDEPRYKPMETRITLQNPRDIPQGTAVLRGGRVITMRGQEVLENADVVVRNNRIVAVGAQGSVPVPADARVIDVSGKTIVPGFVDTHAHMWPLWGIHKDEVPAYAANLAYGVTTTRDPQTATTDVLTYADKVEAGALLGPRVYSTGPGVFLTEQVKDKEHALRVLRRYSDYYDTKTIKMYMAGNREQRQWIAAAARELRLMPTTEGGLDAKLNMTHAIDGYSGIEHTIPAFPHQNDVVRLLAEAKTAYTPTILVAYGGPWAENYFYATENVFGDAKLRYFTPLEELQEKALRRPGPGPGSSGWFHPEVHVFRNIGETAKDVVEAGGRVGIGSHGQLQGLGFHWELWAVQSGGMKPHDALRAATILGAQAIGLDQDLGSIEPGKLADLVILDRSPLENIRNSNTVVQVMKNGRLYDANSLDEVWPRQRKAGPFHWQQEVQPRTAAGIR